MMAATDVLATLNAAGITVTADGDNLRLAPRARLTDGLRALARRHKVDLLAALHTHSPKLSMCSCDAWQLDQHPVHDLPLEQARLEFDALCARLGLTRNLGASPEALRRELPNLRGLCSGSGSGARRS